MKSYKKPTSKEVDEAIPLLSSPQHRAHFFIHLENPYWIAQLKIRGMFNYPPKAETIPGGGIRFPRWPASNYLARMAAHAPSEVADIFISLKTDNLSVIGDMLKAALEMPANIAASLEPIISRAVKGDILLFSFKDASDLCVHLANGSEVTAAMILAEALFTPKFEQDQEEPSRRDEYWYKEGLKKIIPALVAREPRKFLIDLCDWLKAFVNARKQEGLESGEDNSIIWRSAIEEHAQNRDYEFAGVMVGFVRDGFEKAISGKHLSLEDSIEILDLYSYLVFKRIRIHLINEFADKNVKLTRETIMDRGLFNDYQYKHEYAMLVGRRLGLLLQTEKDEWFKWIDEGPDDSEFDESDKEDDRKSRKSYWQFEKMHNVRDHLEGNWRKLYGEMLQKNGEPKMADLNFRMDTRWGGDASPITINELTALTFEQAVEKVSSWVPKKQDRFMGPNIEGLASTFEKYIATNSEEFSKHAEALVGRPAIYVQIFISQMAEAVKTGRAVNVSAVMKLCLWVLDNQKEEPETPENGNKAVVGDDWHGTRDEILRFIRNACQAIVNDAPKYQMDELREPFWESLVKLYKVQAKSYIVYDKEKDDPRLKDYLTIGMNSPRGKAVEAAMEYARWVANQIKKPEGNRTVIEGGFDAMPEVRDMLEWQIASENRSFEALSIIGASIGLINWIDKDWLAANTERLFNLEGIEGSPAMAHGWAAWNAFLVWVRPHIEFYRLFKKQFAYAVAQSATVIIPEKSHPQPMNRLGEHLMLLYGRGQLGLDDDNGLLRHFLAKAHPDIRRHAISLVGMSLEGKDKIPEEVIHLFQDLWDIYWEVSGKKDAAEKPDAYLFDPWFSSEKFPEQWAIDQLEKLVSVTPTPELDDPNMEQLAKISNIDIKKAVRIVDLLARGDKEGWRIYGWQVSAMKILENGINAGGDAQKQAEQVIDYLGRRGYIKFGELFEFKGASDTK